MRIGVLGCGSLGGVIAGKLWNEKKNEVIVFELNPEIVVSIRERGLQINEGGVHFVARPQVIERMEDVRDPLDLIVLTTKATTMAGAVEAYLPVLTDDGCFMTVQNGLMALDLIERYGEDRIVAGCVMWGSSMPAPGVYNVTAKGPFVVGGIDGKPSSGATVCQAALSGAFPVEFSDDMRDVLWAKLTVTASLTSLGAITGWSFGEMLGSRKIRDLILRIGDEVVSVGRAHGVRFEHAEGALDVNLLTGDGFPPRAFRHLLVRAIGLKHRRTESSMLASLRTGAKTEIDIVNGVITELGKKYSVSTPVNSAVVHVVSQMEQGEYQPGLQAFDVLLDLIW